MNVISNENTYALSYTRWCLANYYNTYPAIYIGEISVNHNGGVTGGRVVKDLGSWPRVMGSSPTSGTALFFPFPGVYILSSTPKIWRCFHHILRRGCKAIGPGGPWGTWFKLAYLSPGPRWPPQWVVNPKGQLNKLHLHKCHAPWILILTDSEMAPHTSLVLFMLF